MVVAPVRFNPRPRMEGDGCQLHEDFGIEVSIRAPAWRATGAVSSGATLRSGVSIRAPAWRATALPPWQGLEGRVSIRAPAWRATGGHWQPERKQPVSIRAPAWRATGEAEDYPPPPRRFNPRPRMEGDRGVRRAWREVELFQSAPPHGGRLPDGAHAPHCLKFQSAPPHGGRRPASSSAARLMSFNPRPRMEGDSPPG